MKEQHFLDLPYEEQQQTVENTKEKPQASPKVPKSNTKTTKKNKEYYAEQKETVNDKRKEQR